MPEPPPRKRFQIHLSTAIVLMFVAGALIWANIRDRSSICIVSPDTYLIEHTGDHGWPLIAIQRSVDIWTTVDIDPPLDRFEPLPPVKRVPVNSVNYGCLTADIVFALLILFTSYILLEYLLRHRTSSKKGPP